MSDHKKPGPHNHDGPIHWFFGLSYASYYCVPRLALQEMPTAWQEKFVALVEQLPPTPDYIVTRRDKEGRFIGDPWRNYRRGTVAEAAGHNTVKP